MNVEQFFQSALPSDGFYCAVGIKNGVTKHVFSTGIIGLLEAAKEFDATGHDAYFACHTFSEQRRLQNYALEARSFYLDLDCGESKAAEGKGYATKGDAIVALRDFCKQLALPKPYVIDSGRGLHVYWLLNTPVPSKDWIPVAKAFKSAALKLGLIIDPAVPSDSARILRVPGTHNFKNKEAPLEVAVVSQGKNIDFSTMYEAIKEYIYKPKETLSPRPLDPISKSLMGNYESNFALLARKSLKGTGCAQIAHAIQNAATLEEPLWHAALSIAVRCNDGAAAIHKISKAYPNYDPEETQKKAEGTGGPRTCAWYKVESGNGSMCKGCTCKVTSPIQIGRVVVESSPKSELPASGIASLFSEQPAKTTGAEKETTNVGITALRTRADIPELPFPYFRGKNGGIYMQTKDKEGERSDVLVFEDDLYVTKRVIDPNDGVCAVLELHSPHDPVTEFAVPLKHLQSKDKFRDIMSEKGIVASENGMKILMSYTTAFVKSLRKNYKAEESRTQFGWCDDATKFILGNQEVTSTGVNYSPPSTVTAPLAKHLAPVGDYEVWRKAFNMYAGVEGAEAHIFGLMTAFGAPLAQFSGIAGTLISLVNTTSGTGKTSILRLVNSVMGHPDELMMQNSDTTLTKLHRMGVMNSLCITFDEITNCDGKTLSELSYGVTHGRARNRMRADANIERANTTRWWTLGLTSGNASVIDKLAANKATSDGEMMRVMEFKVRLIYVDGAAAMLHSLRENYGHAGLMYIKCLVKNYQTLPRLVTQMRAKLEKLIGAKAKERFWTNTAALNLVGGTIAKTLGLHDYDMEHILNWIVADTLKQRSLVAAHLVGSTDMVGEFLMDNFGFTLVMNMSKVNPVTMTNIYKMPTTKIVARFEMDTNTLFLPKKDFKEYCVKRQGDLESALRSPNKDYTYAGTCKKRMASGTGLVSPSVDVYQFKISNDLATALAAGGSDGT